MQENYKTRTIPSHEVGKKWSLRQLQSASNFTADAPNFTRGLDLPPCPALSFDIFISSSSKIVWKVQLTFRQAVSLLRTED
jgi:hypothetical protein